MTIAGDHAIQLLACFEALGVSGDEVSRRLGLSRSSLAASGTRLSRILFDTLLLTAAEVGGDALIGLHAGRAKAPADSLFFLALSEVNVGDALREWARLARVVDDSMRATVGMQGGDAWLRISESEATSADALRHTIEYAAGQLIQYLAIATAGACRPTGVRFPHPPGGPVAEYEKTLGIPVTFRHEAFELHLHAADLSMPVVTANAEILRIMREAAEQQVRVAESKSFRSRVELALRQRFRDSGDHSREGVAQQLATSVGTLKRRLGEEQCSFRDVRDEVRRAMAEDLLAEGSRSIGEIAELLDFAGVAAFGKAFRRWTGASPREFRDARRRG